MAKGSARRRGASTASRTPASAPPVPAPTQPASKQPASTQPASTQPASAAQAVQVGDAPATLRMAVWLLVAEAAALGVLAGLMLVSDLTGQAQDQQAAVGVIGYVLVLAGALGGLAWALRRRQAWSRGPAIVLHMLMLPFGIAVATGGQVLIGVLAILTGISGGVLLLAPATRIAVGRG